MSKVKAKYLRIGDVFKYPYHRWLKKVEDFTLFAPHPRVQSSYRIDCQVEKIYLAPSDIYYLVHRINYKQRNNQGFVVKQSELEDK